ncbi:hypothetical protein BGZ76_009634 [Entomortierella beljakovae]|nr:hypothetical protein BGZ76_009634 [Entomortierella beljakovae]
MRFSISALTLAVVVPIFAVKTWDVNIINNSFSPAIIEIEIGDTVRWPNNDGPDHIFVETIPGYRSCTSKQGGFNSGPMPDSQSYQRTFQNEGVVNYKDGNGSNCDKHNTTGTIYVGLKPDSTSTETTSAYGGATISATGTSATAGTTVGTVAGSTPTQATNPSSASVFSTQGSFVLGLVALLAHSYLSEAIDY